MAKFKTSARSIDMLGRQQIAGIPTAVSEIFKNAYDAYASQVRGDYIPVRRTLLIRDDGVGMTRDDFETRWLTVGTDSKAAGSTLERLEVPTGSRARRQMGEKGIGRLAIASLSPQLIAITRARRHIGTAADRVTVSLVQWSLFETPGLTLDDIIIPIREVGSLQEVDSVLIASMRQEFLESLIELEPRLPRDHVRRIQDEIAVMETNVQPLLGLNGPKLGIDGGTAFVLSAVYDDVNSAMAVSDPKQSDYSVSEFQRFLLGFTNTITPSGEDPRFSTEFVRHDITGPLDVIDPDSYFWDSDDFDDTDHTIEGVFDELGAFHGLVSIYGQDAVEVVEPWSAGQGRVTACGPFRIKFGYVQGQAADSKLPPEDFARMTARLEKIGGLYVYRDGIRVLPYGNSDFDYLEIEQRRSLNAGTYFFSYRRMFGAISLDSGDNSLLQEKAGREGFRENRAYREFRDILKAFFVQLAANFFSSKADLSEGWRDERNRLKSRSSKRQEVQEKELKQRRAFVKRLRAANDMSESGALNREIREVVARAKDFAESDEANRASDYDDLELQSVKELRSISDGFAISRPVSLPLSKEEEREYRAHERAVERLSEEIASAIAVVRDLSRAGNLSGSEGRSAGSHEALIADLRERAHEAEQVAAAIVSSLELDVSRGVANLRERAQGEVEALRAESEELLRGLEQSKGPTFEEALHQLEQNRSRRLANLAQLGEVAALRASGLDDAEQNVLLKESILDLEEQLDANLELMQLGQAVQIVSHEFEASIRAVRSGLQDLAPWARSTPRLKPIVRDLRASFGHLDGYLRLFTPLQRRLYRETATIFGAEIERFVRGVFDERLLRHEVQLRVTEDFRNWSFEGYPSTFYPVFVNLMDNAVHWVSTMPTGSRRIELDASDGRAVVRDSGPGVRPRDREVIFERGFSRRRGGRGLGLALAKELLERDGWQLAVGPLESGAEFVIRREVGGDA